MWADNASEGTSSVFSGGQDRARKTNTFDHVSSQEYWVRRVIVTFVLIALIPQ